MTADSTLQAAALPKYKAAKKSEQLRDTEDRERSRRDLKEINGNAINVKATAHMRTAEGT